MDASQFLSRVVAPGNYTVVAFVNQHGSVSHRFYRRDEIGRAAGFAKFIGSKSDAWFGVASYRLAEPIPGKQHYNGKRQQENVQALKAFWLDLDVKREGDKKQPDAVYPDVLSAVGWLRGFCDKASMPLPNLWVSSGYGLHVYWVLEDEIPPQQWQPHAEALKAALIQHNALTDVGISADSARILRIPETSNWKDRDKPMPVEVLSSLSRGDYPNQMIYTALQPFAGAVMARAANYSSGGLAGAPPSLMAARQQQHTQTAAAQSNMPGRREHLFSEIAKKCEQVKQSLANNGAGDPYPLWYLGHLSLAHFCADGFDYVHEISKGDPRYTPTDTDIAFRRVADEHQKKGTGAPTCQHYAGARPGICQACPHWGKINSPYTLGVEDGDLPDGYRRANGAIQRFTKGEDGEAGWTTVVPGDVYGPILDRVGDDRKLTFTYDRAGSRSTVAVMQSSVPVDARQAMSFFGPQGITLYKHNAIKWGEFVVAWIDKLRDMRAERADAVPPFGWVLKSGDSATYTGFAVGGTFYKADGSEEYVPGGDDQIVKMFRPQGELQEWRKACDFVLKDRPDLQVLVAASFAAPLIEFTGHSGFVMSAWSRDSAVGKSSALIVGTTVWASPKAMFNFDDTANSVHYRIGQTKVMPAYWDEIRIRKEEALKFVDTLFKLGQGKDKARLNSDSTLKEAGDWKTMLVTTGNRQLMDYIVEERSDTDAGALRLFEFFLEHPQMPLDAGAAQTIALAGKNAGNAGRVYAKWLAQNVDVVKSSVMSVQDKLVAELGSYQGERFYIAGMACLLVGAAFAHGLGLATFDAAKMKEFLKDAFIKLREARVSNLPVNAGYYDIERVFATFVTEHSSQRLVSNHFLRAGPSDPTFKPLWLPRKLDQLVIHIGQSNQAMRIDMAVWRKWAYAKGFSPADLTHQLEVRWGAKVSRGILGAGTDYATGRIYYIEVPLTTPELMPYNYESSVKP